MVKLTKGCLSPNPDQGAIPIHCFGYGTDHEREMLREISLATEGGTYYFVDNDSDVTSAFGDALGGVLSVVAQNTNVSLRVPEASRALGVSISKVNHDKATKNPDGSYSVQLNDFYAEESRDILFEVTLSSEPSTSPVVHVAASMSYMDTINSKLVQSDNAQGVIARPIENELSSANDHVVLQCLRIKTTEVTNQAQSLADNGQLDAANATIKSHIAQLQKEAETLTNKSHPFVTQLLTELNTMLSGLTSKRTYESVGSKYMQSRAMGHIAQRCMESNEETANVYKSSYKASRSKKMKSAYLSSSMNY